MKETRKEFMFRVLKEARESGVKFRSFRVLGDAFMEGYEAEEIGRVTVAKRKDDEKTYLGICFCSPSDYFSNEYSRKFGMFLALGRLKKVSKMVVVPNGSTEEIKEAIINLARDLDIHWMKDVSVDDLV